MVAPPPSWIEVKILIRPPPMLSVEVIMLSCPVLLALKFWKI
jgi:hypothetical protein